MDKGVCKGCGADIYWVKTVASGRNIPLDAKPEQRAILTKDGLAQMVMTYMPHHATCPKAGQFRRQG